MQMFCFKKLTLPIIYAENIHALGKWPLAVQIAICSDRMNQLQKQNLQKQHKMVVGALKTLTT